MTYALAVICLVPVRLSRSEPVGSNRSMVADLREGWAEFTERSWVWVVVLVFMVLNGIHLGRWASSARPSPPNGPSSAATGGDMSCRRSRSVWSWGLWS